LAEVSSYCRETAVQSLKKAFLHVTPKRIAETKYRKKVAKIESVLRENVLRIPSDEGTSALPEDPDSIILQQLKVM
jgi:hypothetical protein